MNPQSGQDALSERQEHNEINYKLQSLITTQAQILDLLKGKPLDKNDSGLLGTVRDLDTRIEKIEKKLDRAVWTTIGLALPATYGIFDIVKNYLNLHPNK